MTKHIITTGILIIFISLHAIGQVTQAVNTPVGTNYIGFDVTSSIPLPIQNIGDPRVNVSSNGSNKFSITELPVWNGLNGLLANDVQRTTLGLEGETNLGWSILHLWSGSLVSTMQRDWMNVGTSCTANNDLMYTGLLERPVQGGDNLMTDAVIAWGCQDDVEDPDNFRILFLKATNVFPGGQPGAQEQGLETMRITPVGNIGIGDFSSMASGIGSTYGQPRARLDVQFFGDRPEETDNIAVNVSNTALLSEPYSDKYGDYSYAENIEEVLLNKVFGGYFEGVGGRGPTGVYGTARRDQVFPFATTRGVHGYVDELALNATSVGVHGQAYNASGNSTAIGVWGQCAPNTANHWAGYFTGPTWCTTGMWQGSDANIKMNIEEVSNVNEMISQLSVKSYEYNIEDYPGAGLPSGLQYGLLAQDVQAVLPNAVRTVKLPNAEGVIDQNSEEILALNYDVFIPLLIATVQEQDSLLKIQGDAIEHLSNRLADLESEVESCCSSKSNSQSVEGSNFNSTDGLKTGANALNQNAPNPFRTVTTISYALGQGGKVVLDVFDPQGKSVGQLVNAEQKAGVYRVDWDATGLPAGLYHYTLMVDGELLVKKAIKLAD